MAMKNFHEAVESAKALVQSCLDQSDRPGYMTEEQLSMIWKELDTMDKLRDPGKFYPYYPKGIADSWARNDPLAERLLEVLDLYGMRIWRHQTEQGE